jgi:hypothetical protein
MDEPLQAAKMTLRGLSRRIKFLGEEISDIDHQLDTLVANVAPTLLSRLGGKQHAAQLLITAGENIDRLTSEAAFARLCGAAPTPPLLATPIGCGCIAEATAEPTAPCT